MTGLNTDIITKQDTISSIRNQWGEFEHNIGIIYYIDEGQLHHMPIDKSQYSSVEEFGHKNNFDIDVTHTIEITYDMSSKTPMFPKQIKQINKK